ncbi:MAG TPA: adenylate/guanylate cyclase domain-containing protein [Bacteroidota bacterium]|nr:adenylate/guanylate cyclase domain-containing protein [Bacteroidota bacterium]
MESPTVLTRIQKSKPLQIFVLALVGALFTLILSEGGLLDGVELKTLDVRFLEASHPEEADTNIVLIAIDQNSLEAFADRNVQWPWSRDFYALLVDYLHTAGASAVSFDILLDRHDFDRRESDGAVTDSAFANSMRASGNVLLVTQLARREKGDKPGAAILDRHLTRGDFSAISVPLYDRANAPIPEFQDAAKILAVTNFESDPDGISRRVPLVYQFNQRYIPYYGLANYLIDKNIPLSGLEGVVKTIPVTNDGHFLIYWYGRGGTEGVFKYYPIASLIQSAIDYREGKTPPLAPSLFRGKNVFVGGTAPGLLDIRPTPFTSIEAYPGMEIHATMLSNLLNRHFLRETPSWLAASLVVVLAFLSALIFFRVKKLSASITAFIIILLVYIGLTFLLFYGEKIWIPIMGPSVALVSTFAFAAFFSYSTEGRQRRELRRAFNRYLSPTVVSQIVESSGALELGGNTVEGTVYFSDIKDFTNIAEAMQPKELVTYLNEYFSLASDLILKRDAMLDKYIGDAIMAIFGAPVPKPDHAKLACLTALEIQRSLGAYYKKKSAQTPEFITRIGLNSGKMIVGNIGSTKRLDYTAIGDTVNLASRLEGVNKFFGTRIMISENVYQRAKDAIEARELDLIRVKGKNVPIRIYELLGEYGTLNENEKEFHALFHEALEQYRKQQFEPAGRQFENLLSVKPGDGPCTTYAERCKLLAIQKLPEHWDGVFTLTTK